MAPNEYFDAIGEVLAYVLSAEDFIISQQDVDEGNYFTISRDNSVIRLFATTEKRYFTLIYRISLIDKYINQYKRENELLSTHIERYEIDESIGDELLDEVTAFQRISDITSKEAARSEIDIKSHHVHSNCRIRSLTAQKPEHPRDQASEKIWDGFRVIGLLYPYEEEFSPREYEIVAQEVISVGTQIEENVIKSLGLASELDEPEGNIQV